MPHAHRGPPELAEFAERCAIDLFETVPHEFIYPPGTSLANWPVAEIRAANEAFLSALRGSGNVYAIFVRDGKNGAQWSKKYVGVRKSAYLRERITHHLIRKSEATGSKLAEVKAAVSASSSIGLSFIMVQPESLRLYVEETILAKYRADLPWNSHA